MSNDTTVRRVFVQYSVTAPPDVGIAFSRAVDRILRDSDTGMAMADPPERSIHVHTTLGYRGLYGVLRKASDTVPAEMRSTARGLTVGYRLVKPNEGALHYPKTGPFRLQDISTSGQ